MFMDPPNEIVRYAQVKRPVLAAREYVDIVRQGTACRRIGRRIVIPARVIPGWPEGPGPESMDTDQAEGTAKPALRTMKCPCAWGPGSRLNARAPERRRYPL